jgi:ankyrin repeat protein
MSYSSDDETFEEREARYEIANNLVQELLDACIHNDVETFNDMIKRHYDGDIDINICYCDENETSILSHATMLGHNFMVEQLISTSPIADPNIENDDGYTPLMYAVLYNRVKIVEMLLGGYSEACTHYKNKNCETVLIIACKYHRNKYIIIPLIEHAASVNDKDNKGNTPLIYATLHNNFELVSILLHAPEKVNIFHKNHNDKSALDIAKEKGFNRILILLEEYS